MLRQIKVYVCCLFCLFLSPAQAVGQLGFSHKIQGNHLTLHYQLQALDRSYYELTLPLDKAAVEQAAKQFKPVNTQQLRRDAHAERSRQTQVALNELEQDFPEVQFRLSKDNTVHWTLPISDEYRQQREAYFIQLMQDEIHALQNRFPKAKVNLTSNKQYQLTATSSVELKEISRQLEVAMQRSQQRVTERDEAQQRKVKETSENIRRLLVAKIELITQDMQDFELNYYRQRWYQEYQENSLLPDYARIANASLLDLQPVALRLRTWLTGLPRREAINRLLLLIQSIPYDRLDNRAIDTGFLMPLSVLAQNRGDCDSKAVLFAALLRKLYPGLSVSIVLLKQHALVAVDLKSQAGDTTLRHAHRNWVLAEPVGPAVLPLGVTGEQFNANQQGIEAVMRLF